MRLIFTRFLLDFVIGVPNTNHIRLILVEQSTKPKFFNTKNKPDYSSVCVCVWWWWGGGGGHFKFMNLKLTGTSGLHAQRKLADMDLMGQILC